MPAKYDILYDFDWVWFAELKGATQRWRQLLTNLLLITSQFNNSMACLQLHRFCQMHEFFICLRGDRSLAAIYRLGLQDFFSHMVACEQPNHENRQQITTTQKSHIIFSLGPNQTKPTPVSGLDSLGLVLAPLWAILEGGDLEFFLNNH